MKSNARSSWEKQGGRQDQRDNMESGGEWRRGSVQEKNGSRNEYKKKQKSEQEVEEQRGMEQRRK